MKRLELLLKHVENIQNLLKETSLSFLSGFPLCQFLSANLPEDLLWHDSLPIVDEGQICHYHTEAIQRTINERLYITKEERKKIKRIKREAITLLKKDSKINSYISLRSKTQRKFERNIVIGMSKIEISTLLKIISVKCHSLKLFGKFLYLKASNFFVAIFEGERRHTSKLQRYLKKGKNCIINQYIDAEISEIIEEDLVSESFDCKNELKWFMMNKYSLCFD
jgi:hypothetical protein